MRYTVQLRECGGQWSDAWYTEDLARALRFAELAAATIARVKAARVWDAETGQEVKRDGDNERTGDNG